MTTTISGKNELRHYDLDWLRVLGTGCVFLFHLARYFDQQDWHVKNPELVESASAFQAFIDVTGQFLMPLFFLISGVATYHALRMHSNREFLVQRTERLLIPLLVGIMSHVMIQVYIERKTHHQFTGSFFEFVPKYFEGWYGFGGNFAWMGLHLWYLQMVLVFSIIMLPGFRSLLQYSVAERVGRVIGPWKLYLLFLPIALSELLVNLSPETIGRRDFGGWSPLTYLVIFVLGYAVVGNEDFRATVRRQRFVSLALSLVLLTVGIYLILQCGVSTRSPLVSILRGLHTWSWLLTFHGFAMQHLNFRNRFLRYTGEAVLPFYVLHQSVIVIVGYFLIGLTLTPALKYLVLGASSLVIILGFYEFIIRRNSIMRRAFGLNPLVVRSA